MSTAISRTKLFLLLTPLIFATAQSTIASDYQTKHIFLVIIDGVRNDEAFDDSTHQYIPRIWNYLRPLGTIYTELYSTTLTHTTSGHTSIATGTRNNLPNADTLQCEPFRPRLPTVFEYFRRGNDMPRNKVWLIAGKAWLSSLDYSLYPGYGDEFAAYGLYDTGDDSTTMGLLYDVMDLFQPSLVMLNLESVDCWAHTGNWEKYTQAIITADSLVWNLWQRIEDDPFYSGKTTLFVTTDHGRHDDLHGGFPHHGGTDHGVQHIFFLCIGPDIKQDTVITNRRDLIDIAPTVGELLEFETPYAIGTVLSEMIIPPASYVRTAKKPSVGTKEGGRYTRLTYTSSMSISPSLAKTPSYIHLIWTETDSLSASEKKRIMYRRKDLMLEYWSDAVCLFTDIDSVCVSMDGTVLSTGNDEIAVVSRSLIEAFDQLGKPTYKWFPAITTSEDGDMWSETTVLTNFAEGSREIIPSPPGAFAVNDEFYTGWITGTRWLVIKKSTDGGNSFSNVLNYFPQGGHTDFYLHSPSFTKNESELISAAECNLYHINRIVFGSINSILMDYGSIFLLDQGNEPSLSPKVIGSTSKLHFTWSDLAGGDFQVYYRNSNSDGSGLSEIVNLSNSPVAAFDPS
ncbi:MAG: hypothetical protein ACE5OP_10210, partial [Candidatus Glassbacteria bacterium]